MAGIPSLIRLARAEVDERRIELRRITEAREAADVALAAHEASAAMEAAAAAAGDVRAMAAYAAWAPQAARHKLRLLQQCAELARTELAARDVLRDAVANLKRYELAEQAVQDTVRKVKAKLTEAQSEEQELMRRAVRAPAVG